MKTKTIVIIAIVAIAVVALYFWNSKQKNEGDNGNGGVSFGGPASEDPEPVVASSKADTSAGGTTDADKETSAAIQKEINIATMASETVDEKKGYLATLSPEDQEEYKLMLSRYNELTNKDGSGFTFQVLSERLGSAQALANTVKENSQKAKYNILGITENSINIRKEAFDEPEEIINYFSKLDGFLSEAKRLGNAFFDDLQTGVLWYEKKNKRYVHMDFVRAWKKDIVDKMLEIPEKLRDSNLVVDGNALANNWKKLVIYFFANHADESFTIAPKAFNKKQEHRDRLLGNSKKYYFTRYDSIAKVLRDLRNSEYLKTRDNKTGRDYGDLISSEYSNLTGKVTISNTILKVMEEI